jgi:FlaA1/EpsC-like NDP-sugar epimerase
VFVLDMGEPVKIVDLATRMIQLSGLELQTDKNPDGDIHIQYTGLRPAEKLYEELLVGDNIVGTDHAKIMRANEDCLDADTLNSYLLDIQTAICIMDHNKLLSTLEQAITGYRPHVTVVDHLAGKLLSKETTKEPMQNNIVKLR